MHNALQLRRNQDPTCIDVSSLVPSRQLWLEGWSLKVHLTLLTLTDYKSLGPLRIKGDLYQRHKRNEKYRIILVKIDLVSFFHKLVSPRSRRSMSKNLSWPIQINWFDTYIELYVLNQYISNIFFYSYFRG